MRVLVCGGRNYNDRDHIYNTLCDLHYKLGPFTAVIHGDATGADSEADGWAEMMKIPTVPMKAKWKDLDAPGAVIKHNRYGAYNALAGFDRNQRMIDEGKPDIVIAFPGGNGTDDMCERAKKAGVKIKKIQNNEGT